MNQQSMSQDLHELVGYEKPLTRKLVSGLIHILRKDLSQGKTIRIQRFGTLKAEGNPRTIALKPSRILKGIVNTPLL